MDNEYYKKQAGLTFIFVLLCVIVILPVNAQIISEPENVRHFQLFLDPDSLPVYGYDVVSAFPHDSNAFTQGLIYEHNALYEGTGLYAQSTLRKVELTTGSILKVHYLDSGYFGEGITMWHDTIIQITWRENTGYVYIEQDTFQLIDSFSYSTEGWGLTHDDTCLIMSDGSSRIYYLDPQTYVEVGHIDVEAEGSPVVYLNELEYIQGNIYANVWYCDSIAIIDPQTGDVTAWLNLSALGSGQPNVLNGIAYDDNDVRLFVTGKLWTTLYEIEVDPLNYPPKIIAYDPPSPCYINVDSVLLLTVMVNDPDLQDSLCYTWSINGIIDTTAHDTSYSYSSSLITTDTVMFKVDDGMFCDSIIWIVFVSDPGIITERSGIVTDPGVFLSCYPNPFSKSIVIDFSTGLSDTGKEPSAERMGLEIFDASGRIVKDLFLPTPYFLHSTVIWDGTDMQGHELPAGVYFVGFDTGDKIILREIIRLK
jgi:glutamine cyclotransferase